MLIYRRIGNLRAAQPLLGRSPIAEQTRQSQKALPAWTLSSRAMIYLASFELTTF
jgi:hypothetical protein